MYGIEDPAVMSALEQALGSMTQEDITQILTQIDPVAWTENYRILKGKPFSFDGRNYLLEPYRDNYRDIIFMKGRQVEMSEFSMNWMLRKLYEHPYTAGLHAFPRSQQASRFSKQRLDAAIRDSGKLLKWYNDRESEQVMRKFSGQETKEGLVPYNFYILGGTWESKKDTVGDAARGITLDFIAYDERQDHPDDVETVLGEGASHSEFKQSITLGTPKMPGIQFDQQWECSDKRYWFVKCDHCGWENPIDMNCILDSGDDDIGYYYGCPHCRAKLDRNNGRWFPTNPQKRPQYHGYHISQLMVCWIDANEIKRKEQSTNYSKRRFYNEVLGVSYGGDDIPITMAMMEECAKNQYKLGDSANCKLFAGVDWGASSYCYIQNKQHRLVDLFVTDSSDPRKHPKEIASFIAKYIKQVKNVVCDAGPDITRFYSLRDELALKGYSPRSVWACYYTTPPAKTELTWNEKEQNVTVGRSECIDKVIDEVSAAKLIIPGCDRDLEKVDMCMEHFTNIAAERAESKSGNTFTLYVNTGADHFLHAKIYSDVACGEADYDSIGGIAAPITTRTSEKRQNKFGIILPNRKQIFPMTNRRISRR